MSTANLGTNPTTAPAGTPATFLTDENAPAKIASAALGILHKKLVLPRLVNRNYENEFIPGVGAAVSVRVPAVLDPTVRDAKDHDTDIAFGKVSESYVNVVLDKEIYDARGIGHVTATTSLKSFGQQVLAPQAASVAAGAESVLAGAFNTRTGVALAAKGNVLRAVTKIGSALTKNNVQLDGRILLVGVEAAEELVSLKELTEFDKSNSTGALRDAVIGKLRGFTVVQSNSIADDAMHGFVKDAITFVTRPMVAPMGAKAAASASHQGIGLRWVMDYAPGQVRDLSLVQIFAGVKELDAKRIVSTDLTKIGKADATK